MDSSSSFFAFLPGTVLNCDEYLLFGLEAAFTD